MYDIQGNKSNLQLADVLKEGSYLLYDFNDINLGENENQYQSVVQKDDANHGVVTLGEDYKVSPLFHLSTVNDVTKAQFIEAITEEVPYYHAQSTAIKDRDDEDNPIDPILYLSDSRDPSINDVHAALQEDDFWHEWFTNIWGREQNKVIRLAYNTLRWPFLSDTQYLNATKFADLLNQTAEAEGLSFDTSDEAVEELNEIVDSKLQSAYSLFNYTQLVPQFLDDWAESLWRSGACTRAQAEREKTIFKLQDLKNEILRRKFAGSSIVYQMILSSIDRQGSLIKAHLLNPDASESEADWVNGRPVRNIDFDEDHEDINALLTFYNKSSIPLDLTLPLFYNSTINFKNIHKDPSASEEDFIRDSLNVLSSLRTEVNNELDWDALGSDYEVPSTIKVAGIDVPVDHADTVLDIQADHVLYHQNSIHRAQGAAYDLPTFNDGSLSLMDSSWIDYIEALAKERQRPSENIKFGAQISLVDTKEDVELSTFSFANNTLKYGDYSITTFTASNGELVEENGETYTFYKGTVPFINNTVECDWQRLADSNLFRFQYDGDKWSDWFNAGESSPVADGAHWLAHNYFVGRATITHQGTLDPDEAVSIIAFNSSKSDDPEVVFGMKNVLDEAEITPVSSSTQVVYGKDNLEKTSYTALNTIITENPVKQRAFVSHATITATSDGMKVEANLPSTSSADVKYTADVTPDLNVSADINFADANMLGENIRRTIQDGRVQVAHHVRSTKAANSNYLVIPTNGHREALTVKNVTLSSIFNTLCSAESYYTEMKYPVPVKFGGGQEIAYRWTGIRTLKEGEYYITCKYPVIYTACNDEEFADNEAPIPAVYASRFKIVVEGAPADLRVKDSMDLDPALNNYTMANIESQIRKADAENNYRLPHRTISVKLYALDGVDASGNPQWSLIGANADILANGLIDLKDVSRPLAYSGSIKMFSTASYRSGLYVNDENGAVVWDGQDADVDEDKVYNMVFDYTANITELSFCDTIHTTAAAEKADYARSVNLLNNDVLTGDYIYTAFEADWSKEQSILTSVKAGFKVTDNEFEDYSDITLRFTEYAKANDLIYFDTTSDIFKIEVNGSLTNLGYYIYDISGDDELPSNPPSSADSRIIKPSTFEDGKSYYKVTTLEDDTPIWEIVLNFAPTEKGLYKDINGVKTLIDGETVTAGRINATTTYYTAMRDAWVLGDPYSQSSARNGLLDLFGNLGYRRSVNNCPFISYLYEGMFTNDYRVSTGGFRELTYATDGVVKKSELSFAQTIYNGLRSSIKTAIQNLTQNAGGVFANIGSMESNGYTIDALDKLYKRTVVAKNIPITNLGEVVERDEVYGNNLIADQNFDNIARWNISKRGMYKSVNSWKNGKDIYCFSLPEDSQPLELTYKFETALTSLETENSICIKGASAVAGMTRTALDSSIYGEGWYLYSYQGEDFVSADGKTAKFTITPDASYAEDITITNPTTGEDETVSRISVYVTKVVVRTNNRTSWTPGLSNTVNRTAERILTLLATPVLYTGEDHRPLLLKSIASSNEEGMEYAATPASKIITLTGGRELLTKDGYTEIVKPWEKRVEVELPASNLMVYSYSASNNLKRLEGASDIALIAKNASLTNGVLTINLEADEYLDVLNATIASSGNVDNEDLTGFNGSEMTGTVDEFVEVHDEKNGDLIAFDGIRVVQNGSVIVEFNFLPIVLNRRKHHLSVNILLKD